jgi:phenylpropionate dioxygenase-like ring-hydroxylating dioxygenase large terminal subunit
MSTPRPGATLTNVDPALRRCWLPAARSDEVTDRPHRVLLLGEPWVLVRMGASDDGGPAPLHAFFDRCPHRQAPLSIGSLTGPGRRDALGAAAAAPSEAPRSAITVPDVPALRCAYHGWCFDAAGRCVTIPALGPAAAIPPKAQLRRAHGVVERHGMVFLCPTPPLDGLGSLPEVPEAEDPDFTVGHLPPRRARACAGMLADNFLDIAHFAFVHPATFGVDEPVVRPVTVERHRLSYTAVSTHPFRESPAVVGGEELVQERRLTYRVTAPFHLFLRLDSVETGGRDLLGYFLQPETAETTRVYLTFWRDDLGGDAARVAKNVEFEIQIVEEDMAVQEAYDVRALPLDTTAELHTRADRSTLEFRRMLADLVAAASHDDGRAAATVPPR